MTMITVFLVAFSAAVAAALLAGTVASGAVLGLLLVYLAPLPLMIVGFAWHPLVAALGGLIACLMLSLAFHSSIALLFAALVAFPAWAATAFLGRWREPNVVGAPEAPTGSMVLAIAGYAVLLVIAGAMLMDPSFQSLQARLAKTAEEILRLQLRIPDGAPLRLPDGGDAQPLIQLYVAAVPPVAVMVFCIVYALNAYLAGRIARKSGRLPVGWPDIAALRLPRGLGLLLVIAMFAGALPGYVGLFAEATAVALLFALTVLGFATLHVLLRGTGARRPLLAMAWLSTALLGFPGLVLAGLGVAETAFHLRRRFLTRHSPPSQTS